MLLNYGNLQRSPRTSTRPRHLHTLPHPQDVNSGWILIAELSDRLPEEFDRGSHV